MRSSFVHVSLVPVLGSGEQKTKPTQHSVRQMMSAGIQPDVVLCRCRDAIDEATRLKLAFFCGVESQNLLTVADVSNIYHVPLLLQAQGAATNIGRLVRRGSRWRCRSLDCPRQGACVAVRGSLCDCL